MIYQVKSIMYPIINRMIIRTKPCEGSALHQQFRTTLNGQLANIGELGNIEKPFCPLSIGQSALDIVVIELLNAGGQLILSSSHRRHAFRFMLQLNCSYSRVSSIIANSI